MIFITIGESPRDDVIPELLTIVGKNLPYREIGLIDGIAPYAYTPYSADDLLVSKRKDGNIAYISHRWVREKLSKMKFDELTVLLCTAEFDSDKLILPYKVIDAFFHALPRFQSATIVVPEKDQCEYAKKRWANMAQEVNCVSFSPYEKRKMDLDLTNQQLIYLDCIGFTLEHERLFRERTRGFVLSARKILGNYLRALLS